MVKSIPPALVEEDAAEEEEEKVCIWRTEGEVRVGWGVGRWVVLRVRADCWCCVSWGFLFQ